MLASARSQTCSPQLTQSLHGMEIITPRALHVLAVECEATAHQR